MLGRRLRRDEAAGGRRNRTRELPRGFELTIRVAPMEAAFDHQRLGVLDIPDAVISSAQAVSAWFALQGFRIARSGLGEPPQSFKDPHRGGLIESSAHRLASDS